MHLILYETTLGIGTCVCYYRLGRGTYEGGLGKGTWCIFHVATDMECSSAA